MNEKFFYENFNETELQGLLAMITESYRLREYTNDLVQRIYDPKIRKKGENQICRFDKFFFNGLQKMGIQLLDFTGTKYDTGMAATPINLDDFNEDEELFVEAMLEPTIKVADSADILKKGIAVLGRKEK
jgi:hypothetical protein